MVDVDIDEFDCLLSFIELLHRVAESSRFDALKLELFDNFINK